MEQRFKSMSLFEFQQSFPDENSCKAYLAEKKWSSGFICPNCGHTNYCKGIREFDRQCTSCHRNTSPTAGTLFHGVKFSLLKAFYIVYFVATTKGGIASTELSRKLDLRQKTCWLFKRKVMKAMGSSGNNPIGKDAEVDEFVVGGQETGTRGRKNHSKKLVVCAVEKKRGGVSRFYARVIEHASAQELGDFMHATLSPECKIKTDKWTGYNPLKAEFPGLEQQPSGKKGENFPALHRAIMMFKAWLRGTHHRVRDLQDYINEYSYRFNRAFMKGSALFENLMQRMIAHEPRYYNMIIA